MVYCSTRVPGANTRHAIILVCFSCKHGVIHLILVLVFAFPLPKLVLPLKVSVHVFYNFEFISGETYVSSNFFISYSYFCFMQCDPKNDKITFIIMSASSLFDHHDILGQISLVDIAIV